MYMLAFFLPTERLWAFEFVPNPYQPIYSQTTYIQHMSQKYKLEQHLNEFYHALTELFHLPPKAINELPTAFRKRPEIQELRENDIFTDFSLFEKAYPLGDEEE